MAEEKVRVFGYSPDDDKMFVYRFGEEELQATAEMFTRDIWFVMTDEEVAIYLNQGEPIKNNLKEDFIWFKPGINKMHQVLCTCGQFLEAGQSLDKLSKLAVAHARRSGHTLNPRGN